jgi:uncharacterized protein YgbK (DUF1537 family)
MKMELSKHVQEEMQRRGIPLAVVESVLAAPAQKLPEHGDVVVINAKSRSTTSRIWRGSW